jgi:hypothetical protein
VTHGTAAEKWTLSDLVALSALQALPRGYVPWTAWSMRPAAIASVVNEIERGRRREVVELGAGASTVFLGHTVRDLGGRLVSVEHDAGYADAVRRVVTREGLDDAVTVEVVPLAPWRAPEPAPGTEGEAGTDWFRATTWYDAERLRAACPPAIDALVVDGPPAGMHPRTLVREPALDVLGPLLADDWSLFLDDADRPAEQEILRRWSARLGVELSLVERIGLGAGRADGGFVPTL